MFRLKNNKNVFVLKKPVQFTRYPLEQVSLYIYIMCIGSYGIVNFKFEELFLLAFQSLLYVVNRNGFGSAAVSKIYRNSGHLRRNKSLKGY